MNIDHEPACGEIGCEAPDLPIACKSAECVHCGKELRRDKLGKWVSWYLVDNQEGA